MISAFKKHRLCFGIAPLGAEVAYFIQNKPVRFDKTAYSVHIG